MLYIDETGINETLYKRYFQAPKENESKILKETNFKNTTCIMAISLDGIIGLRFKEDGYDNFAYKVFIELVI